MEKSIRIGRLLRALADLVDRLPQAEVDALLDGRLRLEVSGSVRPSKKAARPTHSADITQLLERIRGAQTRDEVMSLLERSDATKVTLERIARGMDLPVLRSDSVQRLREKIVESTVGYRINSDAIQGRSRE